MDNKLTFTQVRHWKFRFGKYKDQNMFDVCKDDTKYCEWLVNSLETDSLTRKALKVIIEFKESNYYRITSKINVGE